MYNCAYLPEFASYLLSNHLHDYAREQLMLSRKFKLPLLVTLSKRFTDEQLIGMAVGSSKEYLQFLSDNKAQQQVSIAMNRWVTDQLNIVGKLDITAQDITVINFIRGQSLKKFIPFYTRDIDRSMEIITDIDTILLGNTTSSLDIYFDILKDKITEQSNLATKVIEASPAITFLFDVQMQSQVFISQNVTDVMGYSSEEIIGMGNTFFSQLVHPDDLNFLINHISELVSENTNETRQVEYRFLHKDGKYRWFRTYEVIFKRDENGIPVEILGKTFEISQEKETAMALANRERQLLEAQSLAHIGSYEWNIQDNTSTNTVELYRIFEYDGKQKYEQFMTFVHPDDVQKVKDAIAESFITGRYECEYRYNKNGIEKVVWSLGKVEFIDNVPYRMIGTVQDVTDIKKIESELNQKSKELSQSNESLRQFAFVASHDMKEPLRKVMMFADMVLSAEKGNLSDKSIVHLQKMQSAGRNLYRMVEDILSFSLLEIREDKQKIKLDQIVAEVIELLEENIREKNAEIVYQGLPEAEVIGSQFRQLFQNLIVNSIKFSKKDVPPRITITGKLTSKPSLEISRISKRYLEIQVEDNGIGFPHDAGERIFELFNRMHSKSFYQGTGLGLSICRRIVENHEGVIKAFSKNQDGATFVVVIPIQ